MNEMAKRVAGAMLRDIGAPPLDMSDPYRRLVTMQLSSADFVGLAIAAIKAMREPTEAMGDAGADQVWKFSPDYAPTRPEDRGPDSGFAVARETWREMIDAALADPNDA